MYARPSARQMRIQLVRRSVAAIDCASVLRHGVLAAGSTLSTRCPPALRSIASPPARRAAEGCSASPTKVACFWPAAASSSLVDASDATGAVAAAEAGAGAGSGGVGPGAGSSPVMAAKRAPPPASRRALRLAAASTRAEAGTGAGCPPAGGNGAVSVFCIASALGWRTNLRRPMRQRARFRAATKLRAPRKLLASKASG
mmetsp:Transcript_3711/g.9510  ORF Transcript_3711/g.9510 Transcript_3711/m.9510 type:complete len:200 (-) Transcript_3711:17-616(-)